MKKIYVLLIFLVIIFLTSCNTSTNQKYDSENMICSIEYDDTMLSYDNIIYIEFYDNYWILQTEQEKIIGNNDILCIDNTN